MCVPACECVSPSVHMHSAPEITVIALAQAKASIDVLEKVFEKKKSLFQVVWLDGSCQKEFTTG